MTASPYWIGTSWKMNKVLADGLAFADGLKRDDENADPRIQRFIIPPYTCVREVKAALADTSVMVGAQNMHWADQGAWTGEVSPHMLKDCNLDLVELGHSERRAHFGETDETVGLKTAAAVRNNLIPLICIGETLEERNAGRAVEVLAQQVRAALTPLAAIDAEAPVLLAYEPVWAIGDGGIPATSDYADARQAEVIDIAGELLGRRVPCLYGGSVNLENCAELVTCDHVDGLFIGRAAWDVKGYLGILSKCQSAT
ncbi:MAG: triose-phosphate isomerase [Pseudomonadota bacterium]